MALQEVSRTILAFLGRPNDEYEYRVPTCKQLRLREIHGDEFRICTDGQNHRVRTYEAEGGSLPSVLRLFADTNDSVVEISVTLQEERDSVA